MRPLYKRFGGKILNSGWLNRKPGGGNVPHVTCVKRSAVSSPPTGPAKSQQDNSQHLSSEIAAMSVCLTSTVTSPLWLLLFLPPSQPPATLPCDRGLGNSIPPTCLCFYLVVTVTPKHWATLNEIPACHQSPVDKDVIVVVSEWHAGGDEGGRGGNVHGWG